jgi:predicted MFS family arabinose efflux permease
MNPVGAPGPAHPTAPHAASACPQRAPERPAAARTALSRGLVRLLALACGVTIANIYYAQPLLHTIARSFGASQPAAGLVVTATQAGFAAGLVFAVPLSDVVPRRRLFVSLLVLDAAALAASAAAPGLRVLDALAVVVGLASVVVQMIIPYAATQAREDGRGAAIGTLLGAILVGVLLSRAFAGLIASLAGWRAVYAVAAGLMIILAAVLSRALPRQGREVSASYPAQMQAVIRLACTEPVLRWRSVIGAAQFAAFSCFWTTATFLLAGRLFRFSQAEIGLFALTGAAGAGGTMLGGRLLDRHRDLRWTATGIGITLLAASFGLLGAAARGLGWLISGALLMDASSQAVHVSNQAVIYDLVNGARSRITTVYMTAYFCGGVLGTTAGAAAYDHDGWGGACSVAAGFCGIGLLAWLAARRHERPPALTSQLPAACEARRPWLAGPCGTAEAAGRPAR